MTDSTSAAAENDDLQRYQTLAQRRLQLEQAISHLLDTPEAERAAQMPRYRALAQERDEIVSEMRTLEQKMRLDE
jgi:cell division protein FtsB